MTRPEKIHTLQIPLTTTERDKLNKIKGKLSWREFLIQHIKETKEKNETNKKE